eukprot:scaffold207202_cov36-Tisochrysis_lutea.AAC.4
MFPKAFEQAILFGPVQAGVNEREPRSEANVPLRAPRTTRASPLRPQGGSGEETRPDPKDSASGSWEEARPKSHDSTNLSGSGEEGLPNSNESADLHSLDGRRGAVDQRSSTTADMRGEHVRAVGREREKAREKRRGATSIAGDEREREGRGEASRLDGREKPPEFE